MLARLRDPRPPGNRELRKRKGRATESERERERRGNSSLTSKNKHGPHGSLWHSDTSLGLDLKVQICRPEDLTVRRSALRFVLGCLPVFTLGFLNLFRRVRMPCPIPSFYFTDFSILYIFRLTEPWSSSHDVVIYHPSQLMQNECWPPVCFPIEELSLSPVENVLERDTIVARNNVHTREYIKEGESF